MNAHTQTEISKPIRNAAWLHQNPGWKSAFDQLADFEVDIHGHKLVATHHIDRGVVIPVLPLLDALLGRPEEGWYEAVLQLHEMPTNYPDEAEQLGLCWGRPTEVGTCLDGVNVFFNQQLCVPYARIGALLLNRWKCEVDDHDGICPPQVCDRYVPWLVGFNVPLVDFQDECDAAWLAEKVKRAPHDLKWLTDKLAC